VDEITVAGCGFACSGDRLQHALAVGKDVTIGAVAAEQQEAAQVHRLFEHGLQRVIDLVDQTLGFLLLLGSGGNGAGFRVDKGGNGQKDKDQHCECRSELTIQGHASSKHQSISPDGLRPWGNGTPRHARTIRRMGT